MTGTPAELLADLEARGIRVNDIWDLVNARTQYRSAVPVLMDWLGKVDARVPAADRPKIREAIVRALSVPAARPAAAPVLLDEFRAARDPSGLGIRWVIGNALSVVADDSVFDQVAELARDPDFGKSRQMLVAGLGRSKDPRAVPLLIELLGDEDVIEHAVAALGSLRAQPARGAIEPLLNHPRSLVRREARKALAKLPP